MVIEAEVAEVPYGILDARDFFEERVEPGRHSVRHTAEYPTPICSPNWYAATAQ